MDTSIVSIFSYFTFLSSADFPRFRCSILFECHRRFAVSAADEKTTRTKVCNWMMPSRSEPRRIVVILAQDNVSSPRVCVSTVDLIRSIFLDLERNSRSISIALKEASIVIYRLNWNVIVTEMNLVAERERISFLPFWRTNGRRYISVSSQS